MNKWKSITQKVMMLIIVAIVLILVYDAIAIMNGGTEASISSAIIVMSYKHPSVVAFICLFTGILIGHLFWRMAPNKDTIESGIDKLER